MKTLIGHEYEVQVKDIEDGIIEGWFHARYLTPTAKEMEREAKRGTV